MTRLLTDNPLLLLFVVVAIGYPLGRVTIRGTSLGVASVLFAGLAIGAIDDDLRLPPIVYQLGLVLFVYTVGLANGRVFFASFRRQGARNALLVSGVVALGAALSVVAYVLLELKATHAAGMFAGSLTNTPALAAEIEYLQEYASSATLEQSLAEPIVGYSVTYPFGVLGVIIAIVVAQRVWRADVATEMPGAQENGGAQPLGNVTVRVTWPAATARPISELVDENGWNVVFGRLRRDGRLTVAQGDTVLQRGDLVSIIGPEDLLPDVTTTLGELTSEHLELDRSQLDFRRVFVSAPAVTGHRLRDLNLPQRFGAVVTRVRRGDVEFLPTGKTVLEPGDRVRVVAPRQVMPQVTAFFGDSYRALSEIDIPTFSLGLTLGLLLGTIPIPMPGDVELKLGLAGGPLIVALILGALNRTGPFEWSLPYSANLTLRQFGLVLFLAGVGIQAGSAFVETVQTRDGIEIFGAGCVVTLAVASASLWIGHRLRIPMGVLTGMLAGIHTQPAVLGFALERSRDEQPNVGYAAVFPIATITKIVAGQLLIATLLR